MPLDCPSTLSPRRIKVLKMKWIKNKLFKMKWIKNIHEVLIQMKWIKNIHQDDEVDKIKIKNIHRVLIQMKWIKNIHQVIKDEVDKKYPSSY